MSSEPSVEPSSSRRVVYKNMDRPDLKPSKERPRQPVYLLGWEWGQFGSEEPWFTIRYQPMEDEND